MTKKRARTGQFRTYTVQRLRDVLTHFPSEAVIRLNILTDAGSAVTDEFAIEPFRDEPLECSACEHKPPARDVVEFRGSV